MFSDSAVIDPDVTLFELFRSVVSLVVGESPGVRVTYVQITMSRNPRPFRRSQKDLQMNCLLRQCSRLCPIRVPFSRPLDIQRANFVANLPEKNLESYSQR